MKKTKQFSLFGSKSAPVSTPDAAQLEKINRFALVPQTSESVYIRPCHLAHNAVDMDGERFSEDILADFAATLPGKGLLKAHKYGEPGIGLFFDAEILKMSPADAEKLLGAKLKFPPAVSEAHILKGWFYIPRISDTAKDIANLDAGVARFVSITMIANDLDAVESDAGAVSYYEYKAPGEALEGSLVWLGAQPGAATAAKAAQDPSAGQPAGVADNQEKIKKELLEKKQMKQIAKALGLALDAGEEDIAKEINARKARLNMLEGVAAALGEENLSAEKAKELTQFAASGRKFRDDLIERQVKAEKLLERVGDKPEDATARKAMLANHGIAELQADVDHLEGAVASKGLSKQLITGSDPNANLGAGGLDY